MRVSREHIHVAAQAAHDHTIRELGAGARAGACSAVCGRTAAAVDAEFAALKADGAPIACATGCDYCCHQRVGVLPHEATALLEHLRTKLAPELAERIERRIRENAAKVDAMTAAEHTAARLPCAFLVDGRCSAYAVRPLTCASFHSASRERCEHAFANPENLGTPRAARPVLLELTAFTDALMAATRTGLTAAGWSDAKAELHQALRALLDERGLSERAAYRRDSGKSAV
jgi:Fe-S-cluster containining protein